MNTTKVEDTYDDLVNYKDFTGIFMRACDGGPNIKIDVSSNTVLCPKLMREIGMYDKDGMFNWYRGIDSIIIGKNITKICAYTFNYCTTLTNIVLLSSVNIVEDLTFNYCNAIDKTIVVGKSLEDAMSMLQGSGIDLSTIEVEQD